MQVAPQATGHNAARARITHRHPARRRPRAPRHRASTSSTSRPRRCGVRWQDVIPQLSELGLAALHGSSPLVGIAGYSLGGGMGWLARKHGLQTNSVTALEVVTADGGAAASTPQHEPDLFWALRGGNGNFGVVTAIEFEVYPVAELYAGAMFFPHERPARSSTPGTRSRRPARGDDDMDLAAPLPRHPRRARAAPGPPVHGLPRRVPRRRGRRCRAAARRCASSARTWTRSRWCRRPHWPTWRWTRPSHCR